MLFNCFHCGKSISSKKDLCVYCKTDVASFASELNKTRAHQPLTETHSGTFFSIIQRPIEHLLDSRRLRIIRKI